MLLLGKCQTPWSISGCTQTVREEPSSPGRSRTKEGRGWSSFSSLAIAKGHWGRLLAPGRVPAQALYHHPLPPGGLRSLGCPPRGHGFSSSASAIINWWRSLCLPVNKMRLRLCWPHCGSARVAKSLHSLELAPEFQSYYTQPLSLGVGLSRAPFIHRGVDKSDQSISEKCGDGCGHGTKVHD